MILRGLLLFIVTIFAWEAAAEEITLKKLIESAFTENPALHSMEQKIRSTEESAEADSSFSDPMIGLSQMNGDKRITNWSIGQKFEFPQKYSLKKDIQETKSRFFTQEREQLKLDLRAQIITTYYSIYAIQKIKSLTNEDFGKIREFSRIAESKYAAGTGPMQDSMKAHLAQTEVEVSLISLNQEEDVLQSVMRSLLNKPASFRVQTAKEEISVPNISLADLAALKIETQKSPKLVEKQLQIEEAGYRHSLAKWQYAPDFQLKYQGRISGDPKDARTVSLEMSVPLWFGGKAAGEKSTYLMKQSKESDLENTILILTSQIETQKSKVKNQSELLSIFKTSLIPQAITSFESSMDAYKANNVTFLSLLDSERSLLKVQIAYYRTLTQYIESLTKLESALGYSVSKLGMLEDL